MKKRFFLLATSARYFSLFSYQHPSRLRAKLNLTIKLFFGQPRRFWWRYFIEINRWMEVRFTF